MKGASLRAFALCSARGGLGFSPANCARLCSVFCAVSVKHGKNKYPDLDLDPDAATEEFKAQMFSLTGVEPDRQKVGRARPQPRPDPPPPPPRARV